MSSVAYLEVNGEKKPFRLRFKALKELFAKTGLNFQTVANLNLDHMVTIVHVGLKAGHNYIGESFDVTEAQIEDWIDEDFSLVTRATELMQEEMKCLYPEKPAEQGNYNDSPN